MGVGELMPEKPNNDNKKRIEFDKWLKFWSSMVKYSFYTLIIYFISDAVVKVVAELAGKYSHADIKVDLRVGELGQDCPTIYHVLLLISVILIQAILIKRKEKLHRKTLARITRKRTDSKKSSSDPRDAGAKSEE